MEKDEKETGNWRLMRQDTHGVEYEVRKGLSEEFAKAEAQKLNDKGHKQFFWAEPMIFNPLEKNRGREGKKLDERALIQLFE